mgnify:CR=1 FL=1
MAYVFCNQCGHRNPPESSFCSSCGAVLDHIDDHTVVIGKVDPLLDAVGPADDVVVRLGDLPQGNGDPSLIIEDLHEIIEKLRFVHGIQKITGHLVIDASYFGKKSLSIADGFEGEERRGAAGVPADDDVTAWIEERARPRLEGRDHAPHCLVEQQLVLAE